MKYLFVLFYLLDPIKSDEKTLAAYEENADKFIAQYESLSPTSLYELINYFFRKGKKTLKSVLRPGRIWFICTIRDI